jgi:hypothetical protein
MKRMGQSPDDGCHAVIPLKRGKFPIFNGLRGHLLCKFGAAVVPKIEQECKDYIGCN